MSQVAAVDVVIKVPDNASPSQYVEIDGISDLGMSVSNSSVDVTTKSSAQQRALSTATALKSYSIALSFVCDDSALAVLEDAAFGVDPGLTAQVAVGSKTFTGAWLVSALDYKSASSGVCTGSATLESAGAIQVSS